MLQTLAMIHALCGGISLSIGIATNNLGVVLLGMSNILVLGLLVILMEYEEW